MNPRLLLPAGLLALCAVLLYVFMDPGGSPDRAPGENPNADLQTQEPGAPSGATSTEETPEPELLVDSQGAALETNREVLPAAPAQSWAEEDTRWLEVQLILPPDTPQDEAAWILATENSAAAPTLHSREGLLEQLRAGVDPSKISDLFAAARPAADGTVRLGFPPSASAAWITISGNYIYSLGPKQVEFSEGVTSVELRPVLGAWISGRLLPPTQVPDADLSKLEVKLRWSLSTNLQLGAASGEKLRRNAHTDAEGRFEFRAVPVGKPQSLNAESSELAMVFGDDVTPRSGEHLIANLQTTQGASITGRVIDEAGNPVADADVDALGQIFAGNPTARLRRTKSNAEGAFELKAVSPGLVMLRVRHEDFQDLLHPGFELLDGEARNAGDIRMNEGLAIAGSVFFPDGSPAVDTLVKIEPDLSNNLAGTPVDPKDYIGQQNTATVDASGAFRIKGAGRGPWAVSAHLSVPEGNEEQQLAPGLWEKTQGVVAAPAENVDLVLNAPIHVEGLVLDGAGDPITTFGVHAERAGTQWYMPPTEERNEDFQNEQGSFRLTNLRAGSWTFTASAEGYADSTELKLELPSEELLSLSLLRPVRLTGQVIDPDGRPVVGAEVSQELEGADAILAMQGRGDWPKALSDDEGNYSLEGLAPGAGSVLAKKDGYATSEALSYEAQEGDQLTDFVLTMRRGGIISGEVFGADGKPAAGCMLILQMPTLTERRIINTSAAGTFAESGLTPGQWQVQAFPGIKGLQSESGEALDQATLIAALKMTMVQLEDEESKHVILGEPPVNPVQVSGNVTLGDAPIESAVVSFIPTTGGGMERLKITQLDADGSYSVQVDEPGSYLVTIQVSSDVGRQNSLEFRRTIPEAETYQLDFAMPLGRVSGRVLGPDGEPRPGERVTLNMEGGLVFGTVFGGQYNETVSDAAGEFDIAFLRPGSYALAAGGTQMGGFLSNQAGLGRSVTSVSVEEGQWIRNVTFELSSPGSMRGTVRDPSGALVKGASIFVRDDAGRLVDLFSMAQTNASGNFEYNSLAPGDYTLIARSPSMVSPGQVPVRITAGEVTKIDVVVNTGTVLLVTLIDKSGSDVPSRVSVLDSDGRELNGMLGLTEIMERYNGGAGSSVQRVGPVPPGSYTVRAFSADGRSAEKKVTARGRAERKVKLRMN